MVRIAPVKLQYNPKTLWFDAGDLDITAGQPVIVSTERGTEYGVADGVMEKEESDLEALHSALKPVVRVATEEDIETVARLRQAGQDAMPTFRSLAAEMAPNMNPVMVEYLFDGDKAIFFFESEERVDFRNLVRKLASELHVRVDMRQIGVRDQARMVGGLGHCGQELCCKRMGGEFCPVSIRMAKEQDLSLNPQKISGVCGRLMCCLRYEYEAYKDFKSRAPKQGAKVNTPAGAAKVRSLDVPKEMVTVRLEEDGKQVTFPLSIMDEPTEGKRPNTVTSEEFDHYANPDPFETESSIGLFGTSNFTGVDKLGEAKATHNPQSAKKKKSSTTQSSDEKGSARKPRRRRGGKSGSGSGQGSGSNQQRKQQGDAAEKSSSASKKRNNRRKPSASGNQNRSGADNTAKKVRPGQKSSGLRKDRDGAGAGEGTHRKARRRSHKSGGSSNES